MCVSHDRFFLDRVAKRLLVLDPPGVVDFPGSYTGWTHKLAADAERREAQAAERERAAAKPKSSRSASPAPQVKGTTTSTGKSKDNPYARPFGRLSVRSSSSKSPTPRSRSPSARRALAMPARSATLARQGRCKPSTNRS
jgi:ATPase subunit of ABC transporter with duplicated ATPase domains